jgi:hypothetical protein
VSDPGAGEGQPGTSVARVVLRVFSLAAGLGFVAPPGCGAAFFRFGEPPIRAARWWWSILAGLPCGMGESQKRAAFGVGCGG